MYFTLNGTEQFLPQYIRAKFSFRQSAYKHFPVSSSSSSRSRLSALYRAVRASRLSLFLLSELPSYLREQLVELSFLQLRLFPLFRTFFPLLVLFLCCAFSGVRSRNLDRDSAPRRSLVGSMSGDSDVDNPSSWSRLSAIFLDI